MAASVYEGCLDAVLQVLQGLTLAGLPAQQMQTGWTSQPMLTTYPGVWVTIAGLTEQDEEPFDSEHDGCAYPVRVTVQDRISGMDRAKISQVLLWRQQLIRALRRQPSLPGVPEVWKTEVRPDPVAEFDPAKYQTYEAGLTVLCYADEPPSS